MGLRAGSDTELRIRQGSLVYLVGPHGGGKSLLLQLMALRTYLSEMGGEQPVFVPSHLRVVYVPSEPLFFSDRTLLDNLRLGLWNRDNERHDIELILDMCHQLGLPETVR